ncbi:hypothetical protein K438DRAFT_234429 [Mycena galopus ATCC 62051]|nr:hypothetical protein K438DRAFT_234429 [Mycena galopus ATCC 62051]
MSWKCVPLLTRCLLQLAGPGRKCNRDRDAAAFRGPALKSGRSRSPVAPTSSCWASAALKLCDMPRPMPAVPLAESLSHSKSRAAVSPNPSPPTCRPAVLLAKITTRKCISTTGEHTLYSDPSPHEERSLLPSEIWSDPHPSPLPKTSILSSLEVHTRLFPPSWDLTTDGQIYSNASADFSAGPTTRIIDAALCYSLVGARLSIAIEHLLPVPSASAIFFFLVPTHRPACRRRLHIHATRPPASPNSVLGGEDGFDAWGAAACYRHLDPPVRDERDERTLGRCARSECKLPARYANVFLDMGRARVRTRARPGCAMGPSTSLDRHQASRISQRTSVVVAAVYSIMLLDAGPSRTPLRARG